MAVYTRRSLSLTEKSSELSVEIYEQGRKRWCLFEGIGTMRSSSNGVPTLCYSDVK